MADGSSALLYHQSEALPATHLLGDSMSMGGGNQWQRGDQSRQKIVARYRTRPGLGKSGTFLDRLGLFYFFSYPHLPSLPYVWVYIRQAYTRTAILLVSYLNYFSGLAYSF
jgi:hypothetical protein